MSGRKLILRDLSAGDKLLALELAQGTGAFRPVELAVLSEVMDEYLRSPGGEGYSALAAELTATSETSGFVLETQPPEDRDSSVEVGGTTYEAIKAEVATPQVATLGGFIIFGPTPLTQHAWDIYWIAVDRRFQRQGVGSRLLEAAEMRIRAQRGEVIRIETSSQPNYEASRRFYEKHGYLRAGIIPNFYAAGDDLLIYYKPLLPRRVAE